MCFEVELLIPEQKVSDESFILAQIQLALTKREFHCRTCDIRYTVEKSSLDARRRVVKRYLRCKVFTDGEGGAAVDGEAAHGVLPLLPVWKDAAGGKSVIVVGAGPAGLFAALRLLEAGVRPIVVERGPCIKVRQRQLDQIAAGAVSAACNVCFGEGGAGTFSDGKLFSTSAKRGRAAAVMQTLVHFGADERILTETHPHIGSDKLPLIVRSIRKFIEARGGLILFDTQVTGLLVDGTGEDKAVRGVEVVSTGGGSHIEADKRQLQADALILATGHSAQDVYRMIAREQTGCLEAKGFAMGVRVEHPRSVIDTIQYGNKTNRNFLTEAARYKFTCQINARGVYSFCMCPGGFVIPASTAAGEVVVNGMSFSDRSSAWSNAAFVVQLLPEDVPSEYTQAARETGNSALAGLLWRQAIEREAFCHGQDAGSIHFDGGAGGYTPDPCRGKDGLQGRASSLHSFKRNPRFESRWVSSPCIERSDFPQKGIEIRPDEAICTAPAQRMVDFLAGQKSSSLPETSYAPGVTSSRLDEWLPHSMVRRLKGGLLAAGKAMRGFTCSDALLIAIESRTSCPVRIRRNRDTGECMGLHRLFPAGEGAGWSGGITSSALDGQREADCVLRLLSR